MPLAIAICDVAIDSDIAISHITVSEIVFAATATRQWRDLSDEVRRRLNAKLTSFAQIGQSDVERLKGRAGSRLRVGDWRIIFYTEGNVIVVVAVGNRRENYD
jgi:mRNA interferase RelE/StbE